MTRPAAKRGDGDQNANHGESAKLKSVAATEEDAEYEDDAPAKGCCADVRLFTVNLSLIIIFTLSMAVYTVGVIRTMERRFGLSSQQTGIIASMNDVSHILVVVFIGYIGRKAHKPKVLSVSVVLCSITGFMVASTNFIFPSPRLDYSLANLTASQVENRGKLCASAGSNGDNGYDFCDGDGESGGKGSLNQNAYIMLIFAQLLGGVGGAGLSTLGLAYIDENSPRDKSSTYVGVVMGLFALGPVGGFMVAAVTLRIPEIPWDPVSTNPDDPAFIGAWWLGYVFFSTGVLLTAIPMWFFPKHIIPPKKPIVRKLSLSPPPKTTIQIIRREFRDFLPCLVKLLKNKPFMTTLASFVMMVYLISGIFANIPRYVELHFLQPAFVASIVAGLVSALAGMFGGFTGGFLMSKLKLKVPQATLLVIASMTTSVIGIIVIMLLPCPQVQMGGIFDAATGQLDVDGGSCNDDCGCITQKTSFRPVCGSDNITYFSACHAGCTEGANGTFNDCGCLGDGGTATQGVCTPPCGLLYPYAATLLVMSLLSSTGRVPSTIIQFRIVDQDMRSFALGLTSFAVNLFGMIPGPILFGAIIDSTCILWEFICGQRGACMMFDITKFRLLTHGVSLIFLSVGVCLYIVVYFLVRNKDYDSPRDADGNVIVDKKVDQEGQHEEDGLIQTSDSKM